MTGTHRLLVLTAAIACFAPSPTRAGPFDKLKQKAGGGSGQTEQSATPQQPSGQDAAPSAATAGNYPNCRADHLELIEKENAEYQLTTADMFVVEPAGGRANVGPVKLDFCDRVPKVEDRQCPARESHGGRAFERNLSVVNRTGFENPKIGFMLSTACDFPNDPGFQEAVGYAVQLWVNRYGQSREDAIESFILRADREKWDAELEAGCNPIQVDEEASPRDVSLHHARRAALGCGFRSVRDIDWYIDTGDAPPSELHRLYYAYECLEPGKIDTSYKVAWARVGLCGQDIRALDLKKIDAETAKMPVPLQTIPREKLAEVKSKFADLERVVKPKVDSDPDYKKLLYDAPKLGWDAWVAGYRKHKKAMDATYDFENAMFGPRVDGYKGCYESLESGVAEFFKAGKFKNRQQVVNALFRPIGYTLTSALGSCYAVTGPASAGVALLNATKDSRVWRGPRAASRHVMVDAINEIKANRTRFPMEVTWFSPTIRNLTTKAARYGERSKVSNNHPDETQGVVGTAKKWPKQKETLRLDFKTDTWVEKVVTCRDTNKVDRVVDGKVFYRKKCQAEGSAKRQFTPNATLVWSWSAKGIKPNSFVKLEVPPGSEYGNQLRWGYPIEVYTNKNKTKLVSMYGFAL